MILRRDYRRVPTVMIATMLAIPVHAVRNFARQIGLSERKEPNWSEREIEFLRAVGPLTTAPVMAHILGRTPEAVRIKRLRWGIHRRRVKRGREFGWRGVLSEDQVRRMWEAGDFSTVPDPTRPCRDQRRRIWSQAETAYLLEWVGHKCIALIARYLGRSVRAVEHRMHYLGLSVLANQGLLSTGLVQCELGTKSKQPIYTAIRRGLLTPHRPEQRYYVFDPDEVARLKALRAGGRLPANGGR